MTNCEACGNPTDADDVFCRACGKPLTDGDSDTSSAGEDVAEGQDGDSKASSARSRERAVRGKPRAVLAIAVAVASVALVAALIVGGLTLLGGEGEDDGSDRAAVPTGAASVGGECDPEEAADLEPVVQPLLDHFSDAQERAGSTSRIALSPAVGEMQGVQREFERLDLGCAERAREYTLDYMDKTIDAFLSFMADDPDSIVTGKITDAALAELDSTVAWISVFQRIED